MIIFVILRDLTILMQSLWTGYQVTGTLGSLQEYPLNINKGCSIPNENCNTKIK